MDTAYQTIDLPNYTNIPNKYKNKAFTPSAAPYCSLVLILSAFLHRQLLTPPVSHRPAYLLAKRLIDD